MLISSLFACFDVCLSGMFYRRTWVEAEVKVILRGHILFSFTAGLRGKSLKHTFQCFPFLVYVYIINYLFIPFKFIPFSSFYLATSGPVQLHVIKREGHVECNINLLNTGFKEKERDEMWKKKNKLSSEGMETFYSNGSGCLFLSFEAFVQVQPSTAIKMW